jgi:acetyl esterase/lipase
MVKLLPALTLIVLAGTPHAPAQAGVEKNVVYGMYSGLALLMDVHRPEKPNGRGVVFVAGSGWHAPLGYGAIGLKEQQIDLWGPALLQAGYTVFSINHRAAPRFHYPAAVEDVQRAVRYIRHHAPAFAIDPNRIGGVGGSSGAHLIGLVAMRGASGPADDPDPVNRQAATLQALVLRAGPSDLLQMKGQLSVATVVSFMERLPMEQTLFRDASPVTHVSRAAPPTLLVHGDADDTVPYDQSVTFERALREAGVPARLLRVEGGAHGPDFGPPGKPHPRFPEVLAATVAWLDEHLRGTASTAVDR